MLIRLRTILICLIRAQEYKMKINLRAYMHYKLLNSLFSGLSLSTIFIIYAPLKPIVFSIGGVLLAIGMWGVAKLYGRILNVDSYARILLLVEILPLFILVVFFAMPSNATSALAIYSIYQLIFVFGSYLVRAETIIFHHKSVVSMLDIIKQKGYLAGLLLSSSLYFLLEKAGITAQLEQIFWLYILLVFNQIYIVLKLFQSFGGIFRA